MEKTVRMKGTLDRKKKRDIKHKYNWVRNEKKKKKHEKHLGGRAGGGQNKKEI